MIRITLRTLGAVVAGIFVAFALVMVVELFSAVVHPFPDGFGGTTDEICRHVEHYPQWVLAVIVAAWAATALAGAWTARRVGNLGSFAVVGLLLLAGLVLNLSMLPYPLWFKIASLLMVTAAIFAGSRWSTAK